MSLPEDRPPGAVNGNGNGNGGYHSGRNPEDNYNGQSYSSQPRYGAGRSEASTSQELLDRPFDSNSDAEQRQRRPARERRPSEKNEEGKKKDRICGKCGKQLTGQFVRALGDTYHLECFTCHVSGDRKLVISR